MLDTGGIGTYLAELLPRVVDRMTECEFTLLGDSPSLRALMRDDRRIDIRHWTTPIYTVREQLEIRSLLPGDATLVWTPHYNIPLAWTGPLAVTVHDVAHLALPQSSVARSLYARMLFAAVRRRAAVVLCDSEFTRQEFQRHAGTPRRAIVCHLGVDERWFELPESEAPVTPYFLFVGNVKPHKNLGRLVEAFTRVAPRIPHRLLIAGRREGMRTVDRRVVDLAASLSDRIEFTGYVSPDQLDLLIAGCDALVLPSLYEGFGLPPLEALACGRLVLAARAGSLPEVCGPEAMYFDPENLDDIARALEQGARRGADSPDDMQRRRDWARRFTWERCAQVTAHELRRVLDGPNRD